MKELELNPKDRLEIQAEIPVKTEKRFEQSYRLKRGHKCFEFNYVTKELREAQYTKKAIEFNFDGLQDKVKEIVMNKDCIYVCALNMKNAERKLIKMMNKKP